MENFSGVMLCVIKASETLERIRRAAKVIQKKKAWESGVSLEDEKHFLRWVGGEMMKGDGKGLVDSSLLPSPFPQKGTSLGRYQLCVGLQSLVILE